MPPEAPLSWSVQAASLAVLRHSVNALMALLRSLNEIRSHIPERLFKRDTAKALGYTARDLLLALVLFTLATQIDKTCTHTLLRSCVGPIGTEVLRYSLWVT